MDFSPDTVPVTEPRTVEGSSVTFNPYPVLGAPTNTTWPRGLPLHEILNQDVWNATLAPDWRVPLSSFGVLQSLADIQPDVDAIYRMTHQTPFLFKRTQKGKVKMTFIVSEQEQEHSYWMLHAV